LIIRRLIMPLAVAVVAINAGQALAQGAFPAPLPSQIQPNDPAFPPVNGPAQAPSAGAAPTSFPVTGAGPFGGGGGGFGPGPAPPSQQAAAEACMKGFIPLREEAEKRGKLIKAAGDRKAPPDEACKLIGNFGKAELNMISYVEKNSAKCGIPPQVAEQLRAGHKGTENMEKKVCAFAEQAKTRGPAGPSLSEVLGSAAALPEASTTIKKGGSTFDTLNGNVLTR
jgi:hypothetical protein